MTAKDLQAGIGPELIARELASRDPKLSPVIAEIGPPKIKGTPDPFQSLVFSIVNQQLSMKAARTIYNRLAALFPRKRPTPALMDELQDEQLRQCGVSRQKAGYVRDLTARFLAGEIDSRMLRRMEDEEVIAKLTETRGIGRWTAEMYLIFGLKRPDVLPVDDLGLVNGMWKLYGLRKRPTPERMRQIAEAWRPYRSIGTWYIWRYLGNDPGA